MAHKFHFFRAGGVDQVSLRNREDLLALPELDQKLWIALAMPTKGVDIDEETLTLLDEDADGRIRVKDVLAAIAWGNTTFKNVGDVLVSAPEVALSAIADPKVVAAAKRMLAVLGKQDQSSISVADANSITKAFAGTVLNGDGIVIPDSTPDPELKKTIEEVIARSGSKLDRSGKAGIDQALADGFFAAVDLRAAWIARGKEPSLAVLGEGTAAAAAAFAAVRGKLEDHFVRCRVAAYDPRAAGALAGQETELIGLAPRMFTDDDAELALLPLARIDASSKLPLGAAINPAWAARIATFVDATVTPILQSRDVLTRGDITTITERLAGFEAWRSAKPTTVVDPLEAAWLARLAAPELRAELTKVIAADAALAAEYDQISAVAKLVRMQRDFGRVLRNFVNFSDFYMKQDGVFQAGTLFLDARSLHLCVPVTDSSKHAALAGSSDACLIYCDLSRHGATRQIAAALTNGDSDNVFVGRNGVFYDRQGNDWDATIAKIISSPISVRQAFWSPYKKLVKMIEDNFSKRARAAEDASHAKLDGVATHVAHADAKAVEPAKAIEKAIEPKKIDLGTVAAIGVAIGGIGTLVGVLFGTLFGLGYWLPVGLFGLLMMVSGPSMLLAWLKLRRRNLGPMLDANGWAINARARVNVAFGAAMTGLPKLPKDAKRSLHDPFADKRRPWKLYIALALLVTLAGAWYLGRLDAWLPEEARSTTILRGRGAKDPAPPAPATPAK
ncbi:MAG: hypothetical protein H6Q90_4749 [Deltaproteobacteria bacterium]|nr:hypothetical protein [Deltaproteobacteria bacterium]